MRIRPQILLAIAVLAAISGYSLYLGLETPAGVGLGGIIALGTNILEKD